MEIKIRDWTDYNPDRGCNGGEYMEGEAYATDFYGWQGRLLTSADFCPYCRNFDCGGGCQAADDYLAQILTVADVYRAVKAAKAQRAEGRDIQIVVIPDFAPEYEI